MLINVACMPLYLNSLEVQFFESDGMFRPSHRNVEFIKLGFGDTIFTMSLSDISAQTRREKLTKRNCFLHEEVMGSIGILLIHLSCKAKQGVIMLHEPGFADFIVFAGNR